MCKALPATSAKTAPGREGFVVMTIGKICLEEQADQWVDVFSTSAVTMAVKAPPMTTPTAMSSTLPRMANALNSSKNFLMPLFSLPQINCCSFLSFFTARGHFIFIRAYCAAICKRKAAHSIENKKQSLL